MPEALVELHIGDRVFQEEYIIGDENPHCVVTRIEGNTIHHIHEGETGAEQSAPRPAFRFVRRETPQERSQRILALAEQVPTRSFGTGDRVISTLDTANLHGEIGRVIWTDEDTARIEFFNWNNGHAGNNMGRTGNCWNFNNRPAAHGGIMHYSELVVGMEVVFMPTRSNIESGVGRDAPYRKSGKIIEIQESEGVPAGANSILVEFDDEFLTGHNGNAVGQVVGRANRCWWCHAGDLIQKEMYIQHWFTYIEHLIEAQTRIEGGTRGIYLSREGTAPTATDVEAHARTIEWVRYETEGQAVDDKKREHFKCDICGKDRVDYEEAPVHNAKALKEISEAVNKKVKKLCVNCYNKLVRCHECNGLFWQPTSHTTVVRARNTDFRICEGCYDNMEDDMTECEECGIMIYPDCERCYNEDYLCYRCYEESRGGYFDPQLGKGGYKEHPSTTFRTLPRRTYGLEIETISNGRSIDKDEVKPWMRYEDGSLSEGGEEFASPIFKGDSGLIEVKKLLDLLKENDYKVEPCCAVHCHVDAKDYQHKDLRRFMLFMHDYEPTIFSMLRHPCSGGAQRLSSSTTRDAIKKTRKLSTLKTVVYGTRYCDPPTSKWSNIRYRGLNLHSYFFRGTVEFRYLGATIYYNEISNFARMCVHAAEYGKLYKLRPCKKPTLKEMAKILKFPKDLTDYYGKWQRYYDEKRNVERPEEERV